MPDAHRAVALHVRMAADRAQPGPGPTEVAGEEREIHDVANGGHRVPVLRDAHRPADDDAVGRAHHAPCLLQALGAYSDVGRQVGRVSAQRLDELVEPGRVPRDERVVDTVRVQRSSSEPTEQRLIATEANREMQVGELGSAAGEATESLRVLEPQKAGFRERVHGKDPSAAALDLLQRREHPGVVRAGVLADHDHEIGGVEVLEGDRSFADADGLLECDAGGLVAHVGAVRQVVRAEGAGEELVGERRLVRRATRCVEHGLVGRVQCP